MLFDIKNVDVFYLAEEGIFMQAGSRPFILDKLNRAAGSFERIILFDNRGDGGIETVTASSSKRSIVNWSATLMLDHISQAASIPVR